MFWETLQEKLWILPSNMVFPGNVPINQHLDPRNGEKWAILILRVPGPCSLYTWSSKNTPVLLAIYHDVILLKGGANIHKFHKVVSGFFHELQNRPQNQTEWLAIFSNYNITVLNFTALFCWSVNVQVSSCQFPNAMGAPQEHKCRFFFLRGLCGCTLRACMA